MIQRNSNIRRKKTKMKYLGVILAIAVASTLAMPQKPHKVENENEPSVDEEEPVEAERDAKAYEWKNRKQHTFTAHRKVPATTYVNEVRRGPTVQEKSEYVTAVPILKYTADLGIEKYSYNYETGNGIAVESAGELKEFDDGRSAVVVRGSYRYIDANGEPVMVTYIADENGFQPQSDIIPPVPEQIARSLQYNREHPYKEESEESSDGKAKESSDDH